MSSLNTCLCTHGFCITCLLLLFSIPNYLKAQEQKDTYRIAGYDITVDGNLEGFDLTVTTRNVQEGVEVATLKISGQTPAPPPRFQLKWSLPSQDIAGYWSARSLLNKIIAPDWAPSQVTSALAKDAPAIALFSHDSKNRLTFAVSDALNTIKLSSGVREEDGLIYNTISFFMEKHKAITNYQVEMYLDNRPEPYYEVLPEVAEWWASHQNYKPAEVPDHARLPMYSTWYSYHQQVSAEDLLEECKVAKKMGFESIIVDDGWQTMDNKRGYAYTGDWKPERIPDMKGFVNEVHKIGMKFLLWYAVPLVGEKSEAYQKLKGKYLRYWEGQGAFELDPRYPEVRKHIIDTYKAALQEWGLDGFKLDFLGRFIANDDTELTAAEGRDFASVNEATDQLMTDLIKELKEIKPDIMIEFRQPYIGPLMRKYGNIFRASDCPNASLENRVKTTDLRLMSGNTAVHSDMIMWHYQEAVEVAALQLLNILFSVPQVSVKLEDIPEDHFKMIRYYTGYWIENRSILLDGKFEALNPLSNYPVLAGSDGNKKVIALYDDQVVPAGKNDPGKIDLINAKKSGRVILDAKDDLGKYIYTIKNCLGEVKKKGEVNVKAGPVAFDVPASGLISLEKIG